MEHLEAKRSEANGEVTKAAQKPTASESPDAMVKEAGHPPVGPKPATESKEGPENPPHLPKNELLSAIDSEVTQREGRASRLGYSEGALKCALVALVWVAANDLAGGNATLDSVVLVFFTAAVAIGTLDSAISNPRETWEILRVLPYKTILGAKRHFDIRLALYLVAGQGLLALSVPFLWKSGFIALSVSGALYIAAGLLLLTVYLVFCLAISPLRLPFHENGTPRRSRISIPGWTISLPFMLLHYTTLFFGALALAKSWPSLTKTDLRLGIMAAGFCKIVEIILTVAKPPPELNQLRLLRTKLAFGWITEQAAQNAAERVLLGPSKLNYLDEKAEEVVALFSGVVRLSRRAIGLMRPVLDFAAREDTNSLHPPDVASVEKLVQRGKVTCNAMHTALFQMQAACALRLEFQRRLRTANQFLDIEGSELDAAAVRVNQARDEALNAIGEMKTLMERWFASQTKLSGLLKPEPKESLFKRLKEGFRILYRS